MHSGTVVDTLHTRKIAALFALKRVKLIGKFGGIMQL